MRQGHRPPARPRRLTHYSRYDAPDATSRRPRAVCGDRFDRHDLSPTPTCAACAAWLEDADAMDLGEAGPTR